MLLHCKGCLTKIRRLLPNSYPVFYKPAVRLHYGRDIDSLILILTQRLDRSMAISCDFSPTMQPLSILR